MNATTARKPRCYCKPGGAPCKTCHRANMDRCHAEARAHVTRGTCPQCGTALIRNLALTGWWQCGAYATDTHRKPEHRGLPSCSFQCFTE